jgi:hypothetical protein
MFDGSSRVDVPISTTSPGALLPLAGQLGWVSSTDPWNVTLLLLCCAMLCCAMLCCVLAVHRAPKVRVQDAAKLELGVMTFDAARELSIKQDVSGAQTCRSRGLPGLVMCRQGLQDSRLW